MHTRRLFIQAMALALLPLPLLSQQNGFTIDGHLDGLKKGEQIVLNLYTDRAHPHTTADSAISQNGNFHLAGTASEGPRFYTVTMKGHPWKCIRLLVANAQHISIQSNGDIDSIPHDFIDHFISIKGSTTTEGWYMLMPHEDYFQSLLNISSYLQKIKDSIGFSADLVNGLMISRDFIIANFYTMVLCDTEQAYRSAVPFYIFSNGVDEDTKHPPGLKEYIDKWMNDELRKSFYGKMLIAKAKLCVGALLPGFDLPTVDGKMLSLKDIVSKSKITIVHLWAAESNNQQRARYQKELRAFYSKYHDKGLNIIGVSGDSSATEWKLRIHAEQYPWENVSDLKGVNSIVCKLYQDVVLGDRSSPDNIVLDRDGKILAWCVSGIELQWYLWKYLDNKNE